MFVLLLLIYVVMEMKFGKSLIGVNLVFFGIINLFGVFIKIVILMFGLMS